MLRFPGVRRAVRAVLHPDRGTTESERRLLTERFQKAEAVFDRLRVPS
jgi:hypothetical protein